MNELLNTVLSYPLLEKRLKERPQEKRKISKILEEIKAEYSPAAVRTMKTLLDSTFAKLYDGISLEVHPGLHLKEFCQNNKVILVPNHQSHADYIALSYIIYSHYQIPVFVAGGINLNVFPIGTLFRKGGCFFIRRKFSSDILYKLTLEAYLYYLIKGKRVIEFFFEGGRSRTGKLLPPRYGLFQMLLEANSNIPDKRPLYFMPVSIVHEVVPEHRSLIRELEGAQKKAESTTQLLKLFKLFARKMGTIHIRIHHPISISSNKISDFKKTTQHLAFDCFRAVGKGMPVTPSALLAFVLLDWPSGLICWDDIVKTAALIRSHCKTFNIPLPPGLIQQSWASTLKRILEIFISNKKIKVVEKKELDQTFYTFRDDVRTEILYFKNTILHHFLIPYFICVSMVRHRQGQIHSVSDFKQIFIETRDHLKFEFYLPTLKEIVKDSLNTISEILGRDVETLEECLELSPKEIVQLAGNVSVFARAFSYIHEGYYIAALTLKHFETKKFNLDSFFKIGHEIFEMERNHGRVVRYPESYSRSIMKNGLMYFENQGIVEMEEVRYKVVDRNKLDDMVAYYVKELTHFMTFKMKYQVPLKCEE